MNINHIFLASLLFVLVVAVVHAQVPIGGFQCDKGICVTTEETVDRIQRIINQLVAIIEKQKKESCI